MANELRIAIRYNTLNVPGVPGHRARQVANDFAISKLSRQFSNDQDFIHCPSDFDSSTSRSVWILCDFNVHDRRPDLHNIPTQFWKVTYDSNQLAQVTLNPFHELFCNKADRTFKPHQTNAKHFLKSYPWGGRENEWEYRSQRKILISERELEPVEGEEIRVRSPQDGH